MTSFHMYIHLYLSKFIYIQQFFTRGVPHKNKYVAPWNFLCFLSRLILGWSTWYPQPHQRPFYLLWHQLYSAYRMGRDPAPPLQVRSVKPRYNTCGCTHPMLKSECMVGKALMFSTSHLMSLDHHHYIDFLPLSTNHLLNYQCALSFFLSFLNMHLCHHVDP